VDANLFNGEYYEHQLWPMKTDKIAKGCCISEPPKDYKNPDWQLGKACLVDQLVGQYLAHTCGLGYLLNPKNVKTTLRSIMKYNFTQMHGHFNHMRAFSMNGEQGLLMASYPQGKRPKQPFPYFTETMTGFEYTAAAGMIYEGLTASGLKAIRAVRARHDGRGRSPWDEAECGHHYGRAMASWSAVLAWSGFQYSAVTGSMTLAPQKGSNFWSTGSAWGTCSLTPTGKKTKVVLTVETGTLKLSNFSLVKGASKSFKPAKSISAGKSTRFTL
jgi:non-lysosomal glucosylceramidase